MSNFHGVGAQRLADPRHLVQEHNTTQHGSKHLLLQPIVTTNKSTTLVYVFIFDSVHNTSFDGACSIGQLLFHGYARGECREPTEADLGLNPDQSTDENLSNTKVLFIVRSDFLYFIFVRPNGRTYLWAAL